MNSTNQVLEAHSSSFSKLTVRTFAEEADGVPEPYVLLEGDADALRFLADLILAHANFEEGCGRFMHPNGPGSIHFGDRSTMGIYLHKLPCDLGHPSINLSLESTEQPGAKT
jgi:hypothetical protein